MVLPSTKLLLAVVTRAGGVEERVAFKAGGPASVSVAGGVESVAFVWVAPRAETAGSSASLLSGRQGCPQARVEADVFRAPRGRDDEIVCVRPAPGAGCPLDGTSLELQCGEFQSVQLRLGEPVAPAGTAVVVDPGSDFSLVVPEGASPAATPVPRGFGAVWRGTGGGALDLCRLDTGARVACRRYEAPDVACIEPEEPVAAGAVLVLQLPDRRRVKLLVEGDAGEAKTAAPEDAGAAAAAGDDAKKGDDAAKDDDAKSGNGDGSAAAGASGDDADGGDDAKEDEEERAAAHAELVRQACKRLHRKGRPDFTLRRRPGAGDGRRPASGASCLVHASGSHWHYVSCGLRVASPSGAGVSELTMRLPRDPKAVRSRPPAWPFELFENMARRLGRASHGDMVNLITPIHRGASPALTAAVLVKDPRLMSAGLGAARVRFFAVVACTGAELRRAADSGSSDALRRGLRRRLGASLVNDTSRAEDVAA